MSRVVSSGCLAKFMGRGNEKSLLLNIKTLSWRHEKLNVKTPEGRMKNAQLEGGEGKDNVESAFKLPRRYVEWTFVARCLSNYASNVFPPFPVHLKWASHGELKLPPDQLFIFFSSRETFPSPSTRFKHFSRFSQGEKAFSLWEVLRLAQLELDEVRKILSKHAWKSFLRSFYCFE